MQRGSSDRLRVVLYRGIVEQIRDELSTRNTGMPFLELVRRYPGRTIASKSEIRKAIQWGIDNGYLQCEQRPCEADSLVQPTCKRMPESDCTRLEVVMSIPRFTELGLDSTKQRYRMLETREAFREVITAANATLRIASPFIQNNILDREGLPDIIDLLKFAFEKGCEIRLLSREILRRRSRDVEWLTRLAAEEGYQSRLKLFDYHFLDAESRVWSSTHAKMIIADESLAYVGSAEVRKSSLANNFEIGCLIGGPVVYGLCEAFDLMTIYATEVSRK